jgi:hypothetical protein
VVKHCKDNSYVILGEAKSRSEAEIGEAHPGEIKFNTLASQ